MDDSPPEVGHVFDGPVGSKDRDFQNNFLLHWHWEGFIDHESGITKYHYALGQDCFNKNQMQFISNSSYTNSTFDGILLEETSNQFASFEVDKVGMYRLSVIAFNGAMEPSVAVCSSGVLVDDTPPLVTDIHLEGSRHQKSVLCDIANADWFIGDTGELRELSPSDACLKLCDQNETESSEVMFNRFPTETMRNGTLSIPIGYEESEDICLLFPRYHEGLPVYLPTDNIHMTWNFQEAESQMLDYFIGISSNDEDITMPDIKGFSSTHNQTKTKCVHCGFGEGDIFHIVMDGRNKAGLSDLFSIGPIIVDMTPASYQGGMSVDIMEDVVVLSWPQEAFYDEQDGQLLLEYEWAVGTSDNPVAVKPFTTKIFPYSNITEIAYFRVELQKDLLHLHNQDRDITYHFFLNCINRAGLHTVEKSDGFTIHSQIIPSSGMIYHVSVSKPESTEPIGFQEDLTQLCARWYGFEHYQGDISFHLGVGSHPGMDDVQPLNPVMNGAVNHFCLDNLALEPLQKYYFVLEVSNDQGSTNASSNGIFVASNAQVLDEGLIINGHACPDRFQYIIDKNITVESSVQYEILKDLTSIPDLTIKLAIEREDMVSFDSVGVTINSESVPLTGWKYTDIDVHMFYHFIHMTNNISVVLTHTGSGIDVQEISLHHCNPKPEAQSSEVTLHSEWTFPYTVKNYVTHFEMAIVEAQAENTSAKYEFIMDYTSVGLHTEINLQLPLLQETKFQTMIKPCFSYTCVTGLESDITAVDSRKPYPGWVHANLNPDPDKGLTDTGSYLLVAEWEGFVVSGTRGQHMVEVYDWTIALESSGASALLNWKRTRGPSLSLQVHYVCQVECDVCKIVL